MSGDLIIVGAGGHARDVYCTAVACGRRVRGFLNDGADVREVMGLPVLGTSADWINFKDCRFVVGIGSSKARRSVVSRMCEQGSPEWDTLVHPSLIRFNHSVIGDGTVVFAGAIFATDVVVGSHVVISLMVTLGHDDIIGDFSTVAPKATLSGNVTTGIAVEVGTASVMRQGLRIGDEAFVGMGAVVTKDVPPGVTVVGNPAKPLVKS